MLHTTPYPGFFYMDARGDLVGLCSFIAAFQVWFALTLRHLQSSERCNCKIRGYRVSTLIFLEKCVKSLKIYIMLRSGSGETAENTCDHKTTWVWGKKKPDVCRTTELSLPIPASVQKKKRDVQTTRLPED
jgi:hypothetical protein